MIQFGSLIQDPQRFDPYSTGPPPELTYPPHDEKLEERVQTPVRSQMTFTAETTQAIGNLRSQLTQLTEAVGQIQQEWETFPSPPQVNRREEVDPLLIEGRVDDRMEDFDSWSESSSEFGGSEEFTPRDEEVGLVNDVEEVDLVLPPSSEFGGDEELTAREEREEEVNPLVIKGGVDEGLVEPSELGANTELIPQCPPLSLM
ncbi:hypothetical protein RHMOL_Rhmol02G0120900 [Rhododendron molle]|uniref:Uncharacterized protein n=1 Tax=Rhododendron molle TaxID=49168 RepID=A0ACC0PQJ1_RHOML|nr:hypothetical protein RHMOL_Rhmol02G0120900 [Rhododendron molle]